MSARWTARGPLSRRVLRPFVLLLGLLLADNVIVPARASGPSSIAALLPALSAGLLVADSLQAQPAPGAALGGAGSSPQIVRATSPLRSGTPRFLFGSYVKPRGGETRQQAMSRMESKVGRRFAIDHVYHGWQNPLIGPYERWSMARGHVLLVGWKAVFEWAGGSSNGHAAGYVRWADIASGRYDRLITSRARELKRLGTRVYLNFHHEPEDEADRPGSSRGGTPADFVAAWRHIWTVFHRHHATNVKFVFILMGWSFKNGNAENFYPGGRYVDAIGSDAYNWWGTPHPGSDNWSAFKKVFGAAYRFAEAKRRPLWVTETGVMEDRAHPDRKAEWFRSIRSQLRRWPNMRALIYFMGGRNGWWVDSSGQSLAAFRALARDRYVSRLAVGSAAATATSTEEAGARG